MIQLDLRELKFLLAITGAGGLLLNHLLVGIATVRDLVERNALVDSYRDSGIIGKFILNLSGENYDLSPDYMNIFGNPLFSLENMDSWTILNHVIFWFSCFCLAVLVFVTVSLKSTPASQNLPSLWSNQGIFQRSILMRNVATGEERAVTGDGGLLQAIPITNVTWPYQKFRERALTLASLGFLIAIFVVWGLAFSGFTGRLVAICWTIGYVLLGAFLSLVARWREVRALSQAGWVIVDRLNSRF